MRSTMDETDALLPPEPCENCGEDTTVRCPDCGAWYCSLCYDPSTPISPCDACRARLAKWGIY